LLDSHCESQGSIPKQVLHDLLTTTRQTGQKEGSWGDRNILVDKEVKLTHMGFHPRNLDLLSS
jgi:hypothetical protein